MLCVTILFIDLFCQFLSAFELLVGLMYFYLQFSGAPFLFGSFLVLLAIIAALFIEDTPSSSTTGLRSRNGSTSKPSSRPTSPLLHNSSIPDREHLFSRTGYT